MFCANCGKELLDDAKFCPECGVQVDNECVQSKTKRVKKKSGVVKYVFISALFLAIVGGVITLYFTSDSYNAKKNIKLAEVCFVEEKYGEALAYYEEALKYDNSLAEAYKKMTEIYINKENFESARQIIQEGLKSVSTESNVDDLLYLNVKTYQEEAVCLTKMRKYKEALLLLEQGYDITGEKELLERRVDVYEEKSKDCISDGEYVAAIEVLLEGHEYTSAETLAEQVERLKERIEVLTCEHFIGDSVYDRQQYSYDSKGNQTEYVKYGRDGHIEEHNTQEYNEIGKLTKLTWYNSDGSIQYWYEYEYDEDGNKKETRYESDGSVSGWWLEKCDEAGNLTHLYSQDVLSREIVYDEGNVIKFSLYSEGRLVAYDEYNSFGTKILSIDYRDGEEHSRSIYECDKLGNQTKGITSYPDGRTEIDFISEIEYDKYGNEIKWKKTLYSSDGSVSRVLEQAYGYEYDELGSVRKKHRYDSEGNLKESYEYDVLGNQIKYIEYTSEGEIGTQREYDAVGNLIRDAHLYEEIYKYTYYLKPE